MNRPEKDCVADTSSLIILTKADSIDCRGKFFRKVYIPEEGKRECKDQKTAAAIQKPFFEARKPEIILPIDRIHRGELESSLFEARLSAFRHVVACGARMDLRILRRASLYPYRIPCSDIREEYRFSEGG